MTIRNLAFQILCWHQRVFGPCTADRVLAKVKEETDEFFAAPSDEEAADIIIALCAWSYRDGGDLPDALERKWEEVRARTDQLARDEARSIR